MFNPTESIVKWYKRKSGSYTKQINLNVDCQFIDGEIVYILNQDEYRKYCNPELYDENAELKEQLQKLKNETDDLRQGLEDAEKKSNDLQVDMNKLHQDHAVEVKELNQKIHDMNEKMQDVSQLNTLIMQDVNRKNLELKDYQNEVDASIRNAVNETDKMANANLMRISKWDFLFHKDKINLNIKADEIIEDNIPARKQGFFEVITTPQITDGDGDDKDNKKEDN